MYTLKQIVNRPSEEVKVTKILSCEDFDVACCRCLRLNDAVMRNFKHGSYVIHNRVYEGNKIVYGTTFVSFK